MSAQEQLKAVATGQVPVEKARTPYDQFKAQLERVKGELLPLMGNSKQNVDAFVRVVLTSVSQNQDLLGADRQSLLAACTRAAQDGLMPDGREAVLNVRNTKVKRGRETFYVDLVVYEPMVAGYIKNMYEHPEVELVDAACVYANEVAQGRFKYKRGDNPGIEHEPIVIGEPGEIVAAYLVVHLKNGQIKREVMPMRDIEKARAQSKSNTHGEHSPWTKWPDQMAIKSVIKRGAKQLPRSNRFEQMEAYDNEVNGIETEKSGHEIAAAAVQAVQQPAALGNDPSPTLPQQMPAGDRELPLDAQQAGRDVGPGMSDDARTVDAEGPQPGVTEPSEQELATACEVKMRAAKTREQLDLAADTGRTVKDAALRLRLDELYEALAASPSKLKG